MLMRWRIILFGMIIIVFFTVYVVTHEEVFTLFWLVMARIQILWARLVAAVMFGLKRLTLKYAFTTGLFEAFKKFVIKVLVPSLLLPTWRRWLRDKLESLKASLANRRTRVIVWYKNQKWSTRIFIAVIAVTAVVVISIFSWQLGLLVLLLRIPGWITDPLIFVFYRMLHWVQKKVIIILAFFGLFKLWARCRGLLPESYLQRLRVAEFKVKRRAIKSRRITHGQFKRVKNGWGLWFAIWLERFRLRREVPEPTEKELKDIEKREGIDQLKHHNTEKE